VTKVDAVRPDQMNKDLNADLHGDDMRGPEGEIMRRHFES